MPSVYSPWLLYSSCQDNHRLVFLTQTTLFPCGDAFLSAELSHCVLPPGACLSLLAAPSHKLYLAPLPPQARLLLGFSPGPVLDFVLGILSPAHGFLPQHGQVDVSKLTFPVQLLSLASCLGAHTAVPSSSQPEFRHLELHICFVSSAFTSCV